MKVRDHLTAMSRAHFSTDKKDGEKEDRALVCQRMECVY